MTEADNRSQLSKTSVTWKDSFRYKAIKKVLDESRLSLRKFLIGYIYDDEIDTNSHDTASATENRRKAARASRARFSNNNAMRRPTAVEH
jgi:hypothetical protein